MPTLREVCRHVRSKNAGPYWITVDIFFADREALERYAGSASLRPEAIAALYDINAATVRHFAVPSLAVLKISFPRLTPQGGAIERDMHGGQHYVRLLDVPL